jgi:hypothetical protein
MFIRVTESGRPGFQLRKGEEGLSVFDAEAVDPRLAEAEILEVFRAESQLVSRMRDEIEAKGLLVVTVPGSASLPTRLRSAHAEIRKGPGMTRGQFKQALQELE